MEHVHRVPKRPVGTIEGTPNCRGCAASGCDIEKSIGLTERRQGSGEMVEVSRCWAPTPASDVNPMPARYGSGAAVHVVPSRSCVGSGPHVGAECAHDALADSGPADEAEGCLERHSNSSPSDQARGRPDLGDTRRWKEVLLLPSTSGSPEPAAPQPWSDSLGIAVVLAFRSRGPRAAVGVPPSMPIAPGPRDLPLAGCSGSSFQHAVRRAVVRRLRRLPRAAVRKPASPRLPETRDAARADAD